MTFSQWRSKRKASAGGIKGSKLPKPQIRSNSSEQPITELQVSSAKTQNEEAQSRAQQAQREYEQFMNRQMAATSIDSIDFLETGGQPAAQVQGQRNILWQNYQQAQATADQTEKNYSDLLGRYTTQVANAEKTGYQQMELTELEAKRAEQRKVVARNQTAATQAQTAYGLYMNEQWNQPYDFLESDSLPSAATTRQDQLLDQAYATHSDLTRRRESLFLMDDVYNYRNDMQIVSGMTDVDKLALAMYGCGRDPITFINALTPELRQILRDSGKYKQLIMSPEGYLTQRGYKKEDLGRLAESYGRYLNAERMANTQEKAEAIAEMDSFLATASTYPTAFLGKLTGGVTAVGSTLGHTFGLSNYHSMDVNHPGYTLSAYTDLTRNAVSKDYNRTQQMAYNGLNQIVDDTLEKLVFKGAKVLTGSKEAAKTAGRIYDTVGAYGDVVRDAAVHGTDGNEAIFAGLPTAALHWLTSGINAEELVGTKTWEDWDKITQKYWGNLAEMTQEELNHLGNVVIQTAILAEDSEFMQEVEALMKTGVSEQDARRIVYGQYFAEVENAIAWSYASGFLPIPN